MEHTIIVGGGISGCTTAILLAQRGYRVTLCERHTRLCAGASSWAWGRNHLGQNSSNTEDDDMAQTMSKRDALMLAVMAPFLIHDAPRPEYYFPADARDETEARLKRLTETFATALKGDEQAQTVMEEHPSYYEGIDAHAMRNPYDDTAPLWGVSSNEMPIHTAKLITALCQRVEELVEEGKICLKLNTCVTGIAKTEAGYDVSLASADEAVLSGDIVINAAWTRGFDLGREVECEHPRSGITSFRRVCYCVVSNIDSAVPAGTFKSLLGLMTAGKKDQINFFHIRDGQGIIELQTQCHLDDARDKCPESWDHEHAEIDGEALLVLCQKSLPGILDSAKVAGFYNAQFWAIHPEGMEPCDYIGTDPFRDYRRDATYFAPASEKIPLAMMSAFCTYRDITTGCSKGSPLTIEERNAIMEAFKLPIPSDETMEARFAGAALSVASVYAHGATREAAPPATLPFHAAAAGGGGGKHEGPSHP